MPTFTIDSDNSRRDRLFDSATIHRAHRRYTAAARGPPCGFRTRVLGTNPQASTTTRGEERRACDADLFIRFFDAPLKANPSLKENGGFLDIEKIREKYVSHEAEGHLASFKRYYLNMWDQKENRAIDMVKWDDALCEWRAAGLSAKRCGRSQVP